jgi:hypothetical protein
MLSIGFKDFTFGVFFMAWNFYAMKKMIDKRRFDNIFFKVRNFF